MQASTTYPLPTPCEIMPVLRRNNSQTVASESVKLLQSRLNEIGAHLTVDGFFGSKTEAAVKEFQRRGLLVDGIVGPQTWSALGLCSRPTGF